MKTITIRTGSGIPKFTVAVRKILSLGLKPHTDGHRIAGRSNRSIAIDHQGIIYETRPGSGYWRIAPDHHLSSHREKLRNTGE